MDDLKLVQARLSQVALKDLPAESRRTRVPAGTLTKIKYRTTKNPRYQTVKKLADYYRANPA